MSNDRRNEQPVENQENKVMGFLAGAMPWVISMMFHIGLFLVLFFVVYIIVEKKAEDVITMPVPYQVQDMSGMMQAKPTPMTTRTTSKTQQSPKRHQRHTQNLIVVQTGSQEPDDGKKGIEGLSNSSSAAMGLDRSLQSTGGPGMLFSPPGGNVSNIVYIIDGSGSMMVSGAFEAVRKELYRSIAKLNESQAFHVILYTKGKPHEVASRRLVFATRKNKKAAANFLSGYQGEGSSNPVPALQRAFAVLKRARKPGQLIYLLSDGEFEGRGVSNQRVLQTIRNLNGEKKVHVNTILFGSKQPEAIDVLTKIAKNNRGIYKRVEWGD